MTKESQPAVSFRISYKQPMLRSFFNRFTFSRANGLMCIRTWFQDEFKRDGAQYTFVFSDEDFELCKKSIKNYLQRVMRDSNTKPAAECCVDQYPTTSSTFDSVRMMMCSRSGSRAEIYLGFLPLAMTVASQDEDARWHEVPLDVALCSNLGCHIALLRKMVES
ncbi:MAG: hypothetical protein IJG18_13655 [Kiritimatiellae bacterium]|nr:hypothetical protein [Kiritimatiellia bacterium]